jgi:hypothetical protein
VAKWRRILNEKAETAPPVRRAIVPRDTKSESCTRVHYSAILPLRGHEYKDVFLQERGTDAGLTTLLCKGVAEAKAGVGKWLAFRSGCVTLAETIL